MLVVFKSEEESAEDRRERVAPRQQLLHVRRARSKYIADSSSRAYKHRVCGKLRLCGFLWPPTETHPKSHKNCCVGCVFVYFIEMSEWSK